MHHVRLTRMQSCMLLDVTQLFEPPLTVRALVRFLPRVDPYMLHQLVI